MQNNQKRIATRLDVIVCVALSLIVTVAFGFWVSETEVLPLLAMLTCAFGYALLLFLWTVLRMRTESVSSTRRLHEAFGDDMEKALTDLNQPALLCDANGKILWCNAMLIRMIGRRDLIVGAEIAYFPGISHMDALRELRLEGTDLLLLEMPFAKWSLPRRIDRMPIFL